MTGRYLSRAIGCVVLLALSESFAFAAQQTLVLPKGTTVQRLGQGQFRFRLPDGRLVDVRGYDPRGGVSGDCSVLDSAGRKQLEGARCQLIKGIRPPGAMAIQGQAASPPSPDYVRIDDEVTWLPTTLVIQSTVAVNARPGTPGGAVMINPQPEPPGGQVTINPQPEPPQPARLLK